ncbi:MAG: DUF4214 domain-containing protein [Planctomycetota bacterium]|nr:DUF4214 domain-containing protein [Planctomycetota bacterium]
MSARVFRRAKQLSTMRRPSFDALEPRRLLAGVTEFNVPGISAGVEAVTLGPDGNIWFTQRGANEIGRFNPTDGAVAMFTVPTPTSGLDGIVFGPDGGLWFTETFAGQIGRFDPKSLTFREFPLSNLGALPGQIVSGPDGALWFTEGNGGQVGRITTSGAMSGVNLPGFGIAGEVVNSAAIALGPGGYLYVSQASQAIGAIPQFGIDKLNINGAIALVATTQAEVFSIAAGPDGNVWLAETNANRVDRLTPLGSLTSFSPSNVIGPTSLVAGLDGYIWVTASMSNQVLQITTSGSVLNSYPIPSSGNQPAALVVGPRGTLWFAEQGASTIAEVHDVLTADEGFIQSLYRADLGRWAAVVEMTAWLGVLQTQGRGVVVSAIDGSLEARERRVDIWYLEFLGRPAAAAESAWWAGVLAGTSDEQVMADIIGSPEFYNRAPSTSGLGGVPSDATFITAMYVELLGRTPAPNELASWAAALPIVGRDGAALLVLESPEYRGIAVRNDYATLLDRSSPPSPLEVAGWVYAPLGLDAIREAFEASTEFYLNG